MLGERLEEARKRKGVSIREAAEATKIRGDYLLAMEDNSFDIDLPQIYIRGFLKNYARFLKLDPNKALTDYDAHMLGKSHRTARNHSRESLGQVAIPQKGEDASITEDSLFVTEAPLEEEEPEVEVHVDKKERRHPAPPTLEREATRRDEELWNENKSLYIKIGVISAGILIVSIICIILWQLLSGSEEPTSRVNPELARPTPAESVETAPASTQNSPVVITASENVVIIVEQTIDRKRLYSGTLNTGESISVERQGPVSIRFTNGNALRVEVDGRPLRIDKEGLGRTVID